MKYRNAVFATLFTLALFTAREAKAISVTCEGWTGTASWWTTSYAEVTGTLYRTGDPTPVETTLSAGLILTGGTFAFSASWATVPLDGNYYAVFAMTLYSGMSYVPTDAQKAAFTGYVFRMTSAPQYFTCTAPAPVCGNGVLEVGESCDDGNTVGGDGCSALCTPEPYGCTYTLGYWKTHNQYATVAALQLPWPISEDTQLCGRSWLSILGTPPRGRAFEILAHQYIAARLNIANGASLATEFNQAMTTAEGVLADCQVTSAERTTALTAASILDAYDNGSIGPGHCD